MKSSRQFRCEPLERRRLLSAGGRTKPAPAVEPGLPRYLTEAELEWIKNHPDWNNGGGSPPPAPSTPPSGPIDPVAEYDPMEGLVVSWMTYTSQLTSMSKMVTDAGGRMYIGVTSGSVQTSATNSLTAANVNMANVTFFTVPLNSVWARDYGPRYVYEGNVRVITDHKYNRPTRPQDDLEPVVFGQFKKQQYYEIGLNGTTLVHGGGNFHLESDGDAYATTLITDENPSFTASQVQQIWNTYEGDNVTLTGRFPTSVDSTGHIDMWMQIYADKKVFISDWPNNPGSTQDVICDNTAALMASRGYQVTRLNAYSIGGTHYTYTNMVLFNNIVILPQYNNGPGAAVSTQMFNAVQAAMPGKTVFQLNADSIITAAGAFHCIVQHVPVEKGLPGANGGLAPVVYLRGPNTATTFSPGQQYNIQWITDDDAPVSSSGGVQSVDILLSTDGGATFPATIATNQPALGSFNWTVPTTLNTTQGRIRIVARDGANNTGFDDSDANFTVRPNGYWTGSGDGTSWSNAANWSNNTVPGANDDVFIETSGSPTINLAAALTEVHSLRLGDGAGSTPTVSLASSGNRVLKTALLIINPGSKLDLNDNDFILDPVLRSPPLDFVQMLINSARNGGAWNGSGLTSSAARDNPNHSTTLGAIEASQYPGGPTFDGVTLNNSMVLVKYTWYGDTDFNGVVDGADYARVDSTFNQETGSHTDISGWFNGDFDGNGKVDGADYALIDSAFNSQSGVL